jgi:heme-degrading monooxygenase HmoA
MMVVVFEVMMKAGQGPRYFDLAAALRAELAEIDGFLSVERFQSLTTPEKYVSVSYWRDAAAVDRWRAHDGHRLAQLLGKKEIFADFRITVAEALRSYTLAERTPTGAASSP